MGRVWSDANRFQKWLDVELAATETLAETGVVPVAAAAKIREKARVDANVVRRAIKQTAAWYQRRWLRQPRWVPERSDFAPGLVARTRAAIKTIKTRW